MKNKFPEWLKRQLDIVEKTVDTWSPAKQEWAGREVMNFIIKEETAKEVIACPDKNCNGSARSLDYIFGDLPMHTANTAIEFLGNHPDGYALGHMYIFECDVCSKQFFTWFKIWN